MGITITFGFRVPLKVSAGRRFAFVKRCGQVLIRTTASKARVYILCRSSAGDENMFAARRRDKAITPMRQPAPIQRPSDRYQEELMMPSRGSGMMAPRREGIWSLVPYVAACAAVGAAFYMAAKRFRERQKKIVADFGEVMAYYGTDVSLMRDIVREYKRKLGPGVLRGAMFKSYMRNMVAEKQIGTAAITDARLVKALLRISDYRAAKLIGEVGKTLDKEPSVLGKLLFVSQRILAPEHARQVNLVGLFPYGEGTVLELQRNMVERCYRDIVSGAIEDNGIESPPMKEAEILQLSPKDAQSIFDGVVIARLKEKEAEAAAAEAVQAEDAGKPNVGDLDYPARSAEPAKLTANAYQCTQCGYTMFPAAGREFKFYGDDFVCPTCGSDKSKFVNLSDG